MDFGNVCLFNQKPEDMRSARNLRLRKAGQMLVTCEFNQPHQETARAEAIRRIDMLCPWLVAAECCGVPRQSR